jgi:hypothetical protein
MVMPLAMVMAAAVADVFLTVKSTTFSIKNAQWSLFVY